MPEFEVFKKRQRMPETTPYITVQKRGTIGFNKSAFVAMGSPKAVELLFDRSAKIMGVRGVDTDVEHAYPIRSATGKKIDNSFLVSGKAFTQFYGIDTEAAHRYRAYMDNGVLCIDMKGASTLVTSNRNAAKIASDGLGRPDEGADAV